MENKKTNYLIEMDNLSNRFKLLSKYDSSITLTENYNLILEQTCENAITISDFNKSMQGMVNVLRKLDATFIRMGYGEERSKSLYDLISELENQNVIDDISKECINALKLGVKRFKKYDESGRWLPSIVSEPKELDTTIQGLIDGYYSDDESVKYYLQASLTKVKQAKSSLNQPKKLKADIEEFKQWYKQKNPSQNIQWDTFDISANDDVITVSWDKGKVQYKKTGSNQYVKL